MKSSRYHFPIEKYALLTESAHDLRGRLDEWVAFYQPASPGERELLEVAVMASTQRRRLLAHQTEILNHQIRTAVFRRDCEAEDEVEHFKGMLATESGQAILGLKRSALGCRFLITRWERLERLIREEETLYGNDRNEAIQYQGASARSDRLHDSEGAYLTWLYCLLAQPAPKNEDIVALGDERLMPEALKDRATEHWMPYRSRCRQLLQALVQRELAALRPREELLRTAFEQPARDGAEVRSQVLEGPLGAQLLRYARAYEHDFRCAYQAFLKGRQETAKTGLTPGAPLGGGSPVVETDAAEPAAALEPVETGAAGRKHDAATLEPNPANGIGAPIVRGDEMRWGVHESIKPVDPAPATPPDVAVATN